MAAKKSPWKRLGTLPPDYEEVLVETMSGNFYVAYVSDGRWHGIGDNNVPWIVVAWQPLASSGYTRTEDD